MYTSLCSMSGNHRFAVGYEIPTFLVIIVHKSIDSKLNCQYPTYINRQFLPPTFYNDSLTILLFSPLLSHYVSVIFYCIVQSSVNLISEKILVIKIYRAQISSAVWSVNAEKGYCMSRNWTCTAPPPTPHTHIVFLHR